MHAEQLGARGRRGTLRLTFPGRAILLFSLVALLPGYALGGGVALLPALGLALLLAGALGAWWNLRGLVPLPPPARRAFAGQRFDLELVLENRGTAPARDVVLYHGDHQRDRGLPAGYLPSLNPGQSRRLLCRYRLIERGHHRRYRVQLSSGFPLGIFRRTVSFDLPSDWLALPRLGRVRDIERRLPPWHGNQTDTRRQRPGSEEFWGLREWREGESQHLVHWKISARQGKAIVRELRGEERPPLHLVLDTRVAVHIPGRRHRSFEEAVSLAGTLAEHFMRQRYRLRFSVLGARGGTVDCARGRYGLFALLNQLAVVQPEQRAGSEAALPAAGRRGEVRVVVVAGGGSPAPGMDSSVLTLDVDERSIEELFQIARGQRDLEELLSA